MRLSEIMTNDVKTTSSSDSAESAFEQMQLYRIRHLVVTSGREVVGILSDRDLGKTPSWRLNKSVGDVMTSPVVTGTAHTTVREAANIFRGRKIDCMPVLDDGKLVGIVTATDLLDLMGRGAEKPTAKGVRATLRKRGPARGTRNAPQPKSH